jgi:hypothetical protein
MVKDRMRQKMTALVREWEQSTETREMFARRHGLTLARFEYWKRRIRREAAALPEPTFAPVRVVTDDVTPAVAATIDVVLGTGERLTIREGASRELLRIVLAALRTC